MNLKYFSWFRLSLVITRPGREAERRKNIQGKVANYTQESARPRNMMKEEEEEAKGRKKVKEIKDGRKLDPEKR